MRNPTVAEIRQQLARMNAEKFVNLSARAALVRELARRGADRRAA